ncbi:MBL fold metallo-hydrolase [Bacillus sp. M6-12]|uniref:ComEC/Rec2 family competence protein n=1 Tax=Bacillus sp. M6-12 TaxID=2054166 RepID=UPI000C756242|nr:ComEC/Rec2 family competence protein [Bacillus sp. M6-12]PLS19050.1 MBL fold metallo-hydrolase [Bacillus sp. M6-12]
MIKKKIGWLLTTLFLSSSLVACQSEVSNETIQESTTNNKTEVSTQLDSGKSNQESKTETNKFISSGDLKVYYLDIGQGDSIYIQTPRGDDILIDGGNNDKGDEVVQYLKNYGVDDIEIMIATHPDADHIGGLDAVLEKMKVESVYMPKITHTTETFEDFVVAVKNEGLKLKEAKAGLDLGVEGIHATFLAPVTSYGDDLNTSSAVLKIKYGENSFLFTGDATIESEEDMIKSGEDLQADVLKLGHHGANTSTSEAFLSKVNPQYAVISVGEANRYGHPTDETLQKMKQHGVTVHRTDKQGTVLAISDGKEITFKNEPSLIKGGTSSQVAVAPSKSVNTPAPKTNTTGTPSKGSDASIQASVDNPNPGQNETITLSVAGATGAPYTAVLHFKSKDTTYTGSVGTPLPIRIGRSSSGFEVVIDITANINGNDVQTQTSFTAQ